LAVPLLAFPRGEIVSAGTLPRRLRAETAVFLIILRLDSFRQTFHTLKLVSKKTRAAFFRNDPRTVCPRRIVANVLRVPAFQFGDPLTLLVLAEADNSAFHKNHGTL
jgi:hypothetical protein